MEEKLFTLEQIAEQFMTEFPEEIQIDIFETYEKKIDQEATAEIVKDIHEGLQAHIKRYPEEAAALEEWKPIDRILWVVKEAYIAGIIEATGIMAEANKMGLDALKAMTKEVCT